ncbi:MAG: 30S ribosomal protein S20 [Firmicutes bacterium]|nr:30S ribosomal protein S20 [Bacillota bacterium]MDY3659046.1 30S ribosomal protein S20 [Eubacteriales bacterium]
MPNIKSAIKRVSVNEKKNLENRMIKSKISTTVKKFTNETKNNNFEVAEKLLSEVFSLLDTAAKDNVIHKNNANSKKATLAKILDNAKKANA